MCKTLFVTCFAISLSAQHLEIEHDSNSSDPGIRIIETSDNDFTRINFNNVNNLTDRWTLATNLGTTANHTIGWYLNGSGRLVYTEDSKELAVGANEIDLLGDGTTDIRIRIRGGGANHFIFNDDSNQNALKLESNDDFAINTGGQNERVRIDGTTGDITLSEDVTVSNELTVLQDLVLDGQSNPRIDFQNSSPPATGAEIYFDYDGTGIPNNGGNAGDLVLRNTRVVGDIEFYVNNTDKIFRLSSSEVAEVTGDLHVKHDIGSSTAGLRIQNIQATGTRWWSFYNRSSGTNRLSLTNSDSPGTYVGTFATNGVYTSSDRKLKKNISDLNYSIEDVMKIQTRQFLFKDAEEEGLTIGFIAQELNEVVPEVVIYDEEADQYSVNYSAMSTVAIKAIQDQQEMIETLKTENELLKTQLDEIKAAQEEILARINE